MDTNKILLFVMRISVFIALIISFYFFILAFVFKHKVYNLTFDSWTFPMLLAIFVDISFLLDVN